MRVKPFLKWAGGKYRLLAQILPELPAGRRLVEPFAGSAAVYLNAPFERALVCDANQDLIGLYNSLQGDGEDFIALCRTFFIPQNNAKDRYYELRRQFNAAADPKLRAALLLYLNRHSYNGLIRYNLKGVFNVPFGRYKKPRFPQEEMLDFYRRTKNAETSFVAADFRQAFAMLRPGDVVYCDPPYLPLSRTANFTAYAGKTFGEEDQAALAALALKTASRGIPVVLSNHDTPAGRALYAGASLKMFQTRRFISRDAGKRGLASELLAIYQTPSR